MTVIMIFDIPLCNSKGTLHLFFEKVFLSSVNTQTVIRQLLVFGVTPFKIGQNKNQKLSIDKVQNLGNKKDVNMQRPSPRFRPEEYFV